MTNTVGLFGGKFRIVHNGHLYCLLTAAALVDELHVFVLHDPHEEATSRYLIEPARRVRWLRTLAMHLPNVKVHDALYHRDGMGIVDWHSGAVEIKQRVGQPITHVFSSESHYTPYFKQLYPTASHVIVDAERKRFNISATDIETDGVYTHWNMLPEIVRRHFVKRVAIVGVESTGKSVMARNLALLFNTNYVSEYGRTYFEQFNSYETLADDFLKIAYTHKHLEEQALINANRVIFIDTDAIVTQTFLQRFHGNVSAVLDEMAKAQQYDLYLYLANTTEWKDDGTRQHLDSHDHLVRFMSKMLYEIGANYRVISAASHHERLMQAQEIVSSLIHSTPAID